MSGQRATNLDGDRMDRELRAWLREQEAPAGYLTEILGTTTRTRQRRAWIQLPRWLADATWFGRPGLARVVVVGLLLAALLGSILVVGAVLLNPLEREPISWRDVAPSANRGRVAYAQTPGLPALQLTLLSDIGTKRRIFVAASGAVRIESFDSPDATAPVWYEVMAGTGSAHLYRYGSATYWYEQPDSISQDPRGFVYDEALGPAMAPRSHALEDCTGSPRGNWGYAGRSWRFVGREVVLGRDVTHVTCEHDEIWVDDETRLVLRSIGPGLDANQQPIPGETRTLEVVELTFGQPAAELFGMDAPEGATLVADRSTYLRHHCVLGGECLASAPPVATPPPAVAPPLEGDPDALVSLAGQPRAPMPALDITLRRYNTGTNSHETRSRFLSDGSGRYRIETVHDLGTLGSMTQIQLSTADGLYTADVADGATTWYREPLRNASGDLPIVPPYGCDNGWEAVSVDLVAGRVADHFACPTGERQPEVWIDREFRLVLRSHDADPFSYGIYVAEIESVSMEPVDPSLFELPPGVTPIDPMAGRS